MLQDSTAAQQFIDKLLQEKDLHGVDQEVIDQLHADLLQRLEDKVSQSLIAALSPTQLATFEHLIDTKQIDKIQDFLHNEGINVHGVIARAMTEFQADYLGS